MVVASAVDPAWSRDGSAAEARGVGCATSKQARMARRRKRRTLKPRVPSRVKRRKRAPKKAESPRAPASRADRARPRRPGRLPGLRGVGRLERRLRRRLDRRRARRGHRQRHARPARGARDRRNADGCAQRPRRRPAVPHGPRRARRRPDGHARQGRGRLLRNTARRGPRARDRLDGGRHRRNPDAAGRRPARDRRFGGRDDQKLGPGRPPRCSPLDAAPPRASPAGDRGRLRAPGAAEARGSARRRRERVSRHRLRVASAARPRHRARARGDEPLRRHLRNGGRVSPPGSHAAPPFRARVRPRRRPVEPRRRSARPDARQLRRRGDGRRPDLGPAGHALRAPARTGHEGLEGRGPEGRPLLRARDDRDPHPRADPRQAGRGRRAAEHEPEPRHPRRHLRRAACDLEPTLRVARQGHLGPGSVDRPRAHAAHPDCRHDRLGQVGLHQHDPHLGAAALDPGRRADDPDRPEANRAQLLRVDPAPAHAGRLQPEGGRSGAART